MQKKKSSHIIFFHFFSNVYFSCVWVPQLYIKCSSLNIFCEFLSHNLLICRWSVLSAVKSMWKIHFAHCLTFFVVFFLILTLSGIYLLITRMVKRDYLIWYTLNKYFPVTLYSVHQIDFFFHLAFILAALA